MCLVVAVESLAYGFLDVGIAGKSRALLVAYKAWHSSLRAEYVGGGDSVVDALCYLDAVGIVVKGVLGFCCLISISVCGKKLNLWLARAFYTAVQVRLQGAGVKG